MIKFQVYNRLQSIATRMPKFVVWQFPATSLLLHINSLPWKPACFVVATRNRSVHYNIETDLKEIMCYVDWISLAQNKDQWHAETNIVMRHWVPGRASRRGCQRKSWRILGCWRWGGSCANNLYGNKIWTWGEVALHVCVWPLLGISHSHPELPVLILISIVAKKISGTQLLSISCSAKLS
jgi:hypothetical protein